MTIKVLVAAGMLVVTQLVVGYFNGLHIEWILWMGHFPYQADTLPNYRLAVREDTAQ